MQTLILTSAGQQLLSNVIAGNDTITFTSMVGSSHNYANADIVALTSLIEIKQSCSIESVTINPDNNTSVEITSIFDNSSLYQGYYVRTIGLYATDSSNNEILYAVAINNDESDYLHASGSGTTESIMYKLITTISNTNNVTIQTSSSGYASSLDLSQHTSQKVFNDSTGAHGIRYYNNALQIKNSSNQWVNAFSILDVYPVGSIYISTSSTNPSTYFGGTWQAFGKGRTLVGVDTNDTDFNYAEKTAGSKYLQNHNHTFTGVQGTTSTNTSSHDHEINVNQLVGIVSDCLSINTYYHQDARYTTGGTSYRPGTRGSYDDIRSDSSYLNPNSSATDMSTVHETLSHSHTYTPAGSISFAGSGSAGNLQPYITTYMWKRTA